MPQSAGCSLPRIGVLLVNYNQWALTEICIRSILRSEDVEIEIGLVDNNSRDPVPEWILHHDSVSFYKNDSNAGVITGNNKAYELVVKKEVDAIILLNNDTEIEPDTLSLLFNKLRDDPTAGLVTPAITYAEDRNLIWHAGGKFVPWKMDIKPLYRTTSELPDEPVEVEIVSACAEMMRVDLYARIGYQDPDFFIYHEDTEHSLRAMKLGFKNYLIPASRVAHHVSVTAGGVFSPFAIYFTHRNRFLFAKRNLSWSNMLLFSIYFFCVTLIKTVIYPLKGDAALVKWLWLGALHGVAGRPDKRPEALFQRKNK
ncbi:MAG TPA: glycosyltransferase family 2 protein [Candidatus Sabulitectum sp.]|nr:glycosyltransferase family 2 protein [Candidatus Sabulitectum sp.]HPF32600.1 glycosyltransferase family 2 protein [Candidatus Sabulitectum sp.]HPJ27500.1 glycosyltransferase family 2 protein [Candidatus Sabulitectum sp.]HPR21275.1 glycosyltransferase family 2 protein [Candidatus Sabulitectum sp.]